MIKSYIVFLLITFITSLAEAQVSSSDYPTGGANFDPNLPTFYDADRDPGEKFNNPYELAWYWCLVEQEGVDEQNPGSGTLGCTATRFLNKTESRYNYEFRRFYSGEWEGVARVKATFQNGLNYSASDNCVTIDGRAESNFGDYDTDVCPWYPSTGCETDEQYWWSTGQCVPQTCEPQQRLIDGTCANPCTTQDYYTTYTCDPNNSSGFNGACPPASSVCMSIGSITGMCYDDQCYDLPLTGLIGGCIYDFDGNYDEYNYTQPGGNVINFRLYGGVIDPTQPACATEEPTNDPCVIFSISGECAFRQSDIDAANDALQNDYQQSQYDYWNWTVQCDRDGLAFHAADCALATAVNSNAVEFDSGFIPGTPLYDASEFTNQTDPTYYAKVVNAVCDTSYHAYDQTVCESLEKDTGDVVSYNSGGSYDTGPQIPLGTDFGDSPSTGIQPCDGTNDQDCYCNGAAPLSPGGATDTWGRLCDTYYTSGDGDGSTENPTQGSGAGGTGGSEESNGDCDTTNPAIECYPGEGDGTESQYPDGLAGALSDSAENLNENPIGQFVDSFDITLPDITEQCISFEFPIPILGGTQTFTPDCDLWDIIANMFMVLTVLGAYRIVMGGA